MFYYFMWQGVWWLFGRVNSMYSEDEKHITENYGIHKLYLSKCSVSVVWNKIYINKYLHIYNIYLHTSNAKLIDEEALATFLLTPCFVSVYLGFLLLIDSGTNDYYFKRVTKQATKQQSIQIITSFKTMEHQLLLFIIFTFMFLL